LGLSESDGGLIIGTDGAGNATSFGAGSGSRSSLADLKIVPGHAVMLATDAVSTEPVS
jgi:hypothetical protein